MEKELDIIIDHLDDALSGIGINGTSVNSAIKLLELMKLVDPNLDVNGVAFGELAKSILIDGYKPPTTIPYVRLKQHWQLGKPSGYSPVSDEPKDKIPPPPALPKPPEWQVHQLWPDDIKPQPPQLNREYVDW